MTMSIVRDFQYDQNIGSGFLTKEYLVWERSSFHASRSLSSCLDATLAVSNVKTEDIDLFDFYS
jgi:hypothetical protein